MKMAWAVRNVGCSTRLKAFLHLLERCALQ